MKGKKIFACLLAASTLGTMITGCTGGEKKVENVTLKYIMAGPGMQESSPEVWSAFNDKLHEKLPNVTVDFEVIPLAEYKQKVMLMMSAREQMDIVNNYGLDFASEISNGSFVEMNDLLDEYGKEVKETLPEWLWDYETVDGKIYGIPSYQMMGQTRCICFIKEYADKYLDKDALRRALDSSVTLNSDVYDILTKYCEDLKADGINFKTTSILNPKGYDNILGYYCNIMDGGTTITNMNANDAAKLRYKTASEWYKKGYIRSDSLSATDDSDYQGKKDGLAFWDEIYTPYQEKALSQKYGNDIVCIPYDTEPPIGSKALAGGTSIMASSEYPEESMQVLNLLQTDKELYNFLVYGREGIEYEKVNEDRITTKYESNPSETDSYGLYKWIVGNSELSYLTQADDDAYIDWAFNEVNNSKNRSKLMGFLPNTTSIADMLTQCNTIKEQYWKTLVSGTMDDWEAYYNEFEEKLRLAGNDKIIEELQKQADDFLKSKN